ncbi:hypothetical protein RCH22_001934 [Cryobacterium psychrotolerans]|nr:hypothetical protein [Cryobacterium psychrotolerans]
MAKIGSGTVSGSTLEDRSESWVPRVGATSARLLRSRSRQIWTGWLSLLALPIGALAAWAAFVVSAPDDPPVVEMGVIMFVALLGACVSVGQLVAARRNRSAAVTNAFHFLHHRYGYISVYDLSQAMASIQGFDVWLSHLSPAAGDASDASDASDGTPVARTWDENIVRPIASGLTSRGIRLLALIPLLPGIGTCMALGMLGATDNFPNRSVWLTSWSVGGSLVVLACVVCSVAVLRDRAELRRGYTTVLSSSRPFDNQTALDLVDWKTGYLLRRAGEPGLTTAIFRNRLREIRAAHAGQSPHRLHGAGRET